MINDRPRYSPSGDSGRGICAVLLTPGVQSEQIRREREAESQGEEWKRTNEGRRDKHGDECIRVGEPALREAGRRQKCRTTEDEGREEKRACNARLIESSTERRKGHSRYN